MGYNYPFAFTPSKRFRTWAQNLRLSFTGKKKMLLSFASVLGDKSLDWATQAVLEHFPEYASAPSLALLSSERQIDTAPNEASAALAARLPYWIFINKLRGTPLGLCIALYYSGFGTAVVVGQNGLAVTLSGTPTISDIVALVQNGTIPSWVSATNTGALIAVDTPETRLASCNPAASKTIPVAQSWWQIGGVLGTGSDNGFNTDFCSRFEVLFSGQLASPFSTTARAYFNGTSTAAIVWNNQFPSASYTIVPGAPIITSGTPGVIWADGTTQTTTGVTIKSTNPWTGYVDVLAYQTGAANPFADPHPGDLARIRSLIAKWKPEKSTCAGIRVLTQGRFWGWPVQAWRANTFWQPCTFASFTP